MYRVSQYYTWYTYTWYTHVTYVLYDFKYDSFALWENANFPFCTMTFNNFQAADTVTVRLPAVQQFRSSVFLDQIP